MTKMTEFLKLIVFFIIKLLCKGINKSKILNILFLQNTANYPKI